MGAIKDIFHKPVYGDGFYGDILLPKESGDDQQSYADKMHQSYREALARKQQPPSKEAAND